MPTIFIALQCFQCSTMQVKQQKKSSNKWTCVICNQKQSVRKVFAQGFMAKDIRKFVQSFNTNRLIADQQLLDDESLAAPSDEIENPCRSNQKKERTDWTEYIDQEDKDDRKIEDEQTGNVFEPVTVTELPTELFKKPKLRNYSAGVSVVEDERLLRPFFFKRNSNKQIGSGAKELLRVGQSTTKMQTAKWSNYLDQSDADSFTEKVPLTQRSTTTVNRSSTWNTYSIEASDNDGLQHGGQAFGSDAGLRSRPTLMTRLVYQNVKEDKKPRKHEAAVIAGGAPKCSYQNSHTSGRISGEKEPMRCHSATTNTGASKWSDYLSQEDDDGNGNFAELLRRQGSTVLKGAKKWNDRDDLQTGNGGRRAFASDMVQCNHTPALETRLDDQRVEEDIHPDFQ